MDKSSQKNDRIGTGLTCCTLCWFHRYGSQEEDEAFSSSLHKTISLWPRQIPLVFKRARAMRWQPLHLLSDCLMRACLTEINLYDHPANGLTGIRHDQDCSCGRYFSTGSARRLG